MTPYISRVEGAATNCPAPMHPHWEWQHAAYRSKSAQCKYCFFLREGLTRILILVFHGNCVLMYSKNVRIIGRKKLLGFYPAWQSVLRHSVSCLWCEISKLQVRGTYYWIFHIPAFDNLATSHLNLALRRHAYSYVLRHIFLFYRQLYYCFQCFVNKRYLSELLEIFWSSLHHIKFKEELMFSIL